MENDWGSEQQWKLWGKQQGDEELLLILITPFRDNFPKVIALMSLENTTPSTSFVAEMNLNLP